jgi:S1-C subfamily serine protease
MRNRWIFLVVVCLVVLPGTAAGSEQSAATDDPGDRHRALREAVENIRIQYAPHTGVSEGFTYHFESNRPGLGIILRAGSYFPRNTSETGAEIMAVTPGSPADEAGLQPGDVVVAWNGEVLSEAEEEPYWSGGKASRELIARSRKLEEGDSVTLRILRDQEELEVTLVAREVDFMPSLAPELATRIRKGSDFDFHAAPVFAGKTGKAWFIPRGWLDMELVEINPELGSYFGSDTGVLVVRGPENDETLGLASGDVILRIGDREVKNPEHAMRILRSYEPDEELSIDIIRHGRSQTLSGTVPETSFGFDYRFWGSEERNQ